MQRDAVDGMQTRSGPPVETAMSANHGYSGPMPDRTLQQAATAPVAVPAEQAAVSQQLTEPKEEDDGQEAAADNQLELQQHAESIDDKVGLPESGSKHIVAPVSSPQTAPCSTEKLDDGVCHVIKVRPNSQLKLASI